MKLHTFAFAAGTLLLLEASAQAAPHRDRRARDPEDPPHGSRSARAELHGPVVRAERVLCVPDRGDGLGGRGDGGRRLGRRSRGAVGQVARGELGARLPRGLPRHRDPVEPERRDRALARPARPQGRRVLRRDAQRLPGLDRRGADAGVLGRDPRARRAGARDVRGQGHGHGRRRRHDRRRPHRPRARLLPALDLLARQRLRLRLGRPLPGPLRRVRGAQLRRSAARGDQRPLLPGRAQPPPHDQRPRLRAAHLERPGRLHHLRHPLRPLPRRHRAHGAEPARGREDHDHPVRRRPGRGELRHVGHALQGEGLVRPRLRLHLRRAAERLRLDGHPEARLRRARGRSALPHPDHDEHPGGDVERRGLVDRHPRAHRQLHVRHAGRHVPGQPALAVRRVPDGLEQAALDVPVVRALELVLERRRGGRGRLSPPCSSTRRPSRTA